MQQPCEMVYLDESIRVYPVVVGNLIDKTLVIGDLHANAMKALYLLVRYGVLSFDDHALFAEAWAIYDKPTAALTAEDLARFEEIVNGAAVLNLPGLINFIGDEFADRGKNDFFTALVFQKLHDSHVPYRIQLSNHGSYLLYYAETGRQQPELGPGQTASLDNYIALKHRLPGVEEKFMQLLVAAYKDHLCLIGYAQPVGGPVCLFTHAPIDNHTLQSLADYFCVIYDSSSVEGLVSSIDAINAAVSQFLQGGRFSSILDSTAYIAAPNIRTNTVTRNPVYEILWNRQPIRCGLPCAALNVHGHVGDFANVRVFSPSHLNTDSDWGKPDEAVYDKKTGVLLGVIPADDQKRCPMFVTHVSPQDRLSLFYRDAALSLSAATGVMLDETAGSDIAATTAVDEDTTVAASSVLLDETAGSENSSVASVVDESLLAPSKRKSSAVTISPLSEEDPVHFSSKSAKF